MIGLMKQNEENESQTREVRHLMPSPVSPVFDWPAHSVQTQSTRRLNSRRDESVAAILILVDVTVMNIYSANRANPL